MLLAVGAFLAYYGLATPYPIVDMNGDGVIDWRDYDVNEDGIVDMLDLVSVADAYGSTVGDEKYNARCDFNQDGVIDDYDVNAIKDYFGQGNLSIIQLLIYRAGTFKGMLAITGIICIILAIILLFIWK